MDHYAQELEFTPDEPHVEKISGIHRLHNDRQGEQESSKKQERRQTREKRHPADHLKTISTAAKASNDKLAARGLPYRFCVLEKDGRVIIDLVRLDERGEVVEEVRRDITNEDFDRLIGDVSSIEGLLIDRDG